MPYYNYFRLYYHRLEQLPNLIKFCPSLQPQNYHYYFLQTEFLTYRSQFSTTHSHLCPIEF